MKIEYAFITPAGNRAEVIIKEEPLPTLIDWLNRRKPFLARTVSASLTSNKGTVLGYAYCSNLEKKYTFIRGARVALTNALDTIEGDPKYLRKLRIKAWTGFWESHIHYNLNDLFK